MANNPFDVSSFNLLEFAKTYGDMMDPKNPKDIAIATKDINGGVTTRVLPNLAKMYNTIKDQFRSNRNKLINGKMWLRERVETGVLDNNNFSYTLDGWKTQVMDLSGITEQSNFMPVGKSLFRNKDPFKDGSLVAYILAGDRSLKDLTGKTTWKTSKNNWGTKGPYGDSKVISGNGNGNAESSGALYSDDIKNYLKGKKVTISMRINMKTLWEQPHLFNGGKNTFEVAINQGTMQEASGDDWDWHNVLGSNEEYNLKLPINRWYTLTTVWDGTIGKIKIYINGVLVYSKNNKKQVNDFDRFGIGARFDDSKKQERYVANMLVQDVKIYNKILTDDEVIKDYLNNDAYIPMTNMLTTVGHLYQTNYRKLGVAQILENKTALDIVANHKKAYLSFMFASNRNGKFTSMIKLRDPAGWESLVKTFEYNGNGKPQLIVVEFDVSKFHYKPTPNSGSGMYIWPIRTGVDAMVDKDGYYDRGINNVKGNVIFKQGDYFSITNVQFETDIPTVFEEIPYEVDKKRAQRYFEKKYVTAIYKGADDFFMDLQYEEKRAIPKITGYSTFNLQKNTMRAHSTSSDDRRNVDFRTLSYAPATRFNTLIGNNGFTPKSSNDAVLSALVEIDASL